ncbi:hypothetical protein [Aeromonas veronii]|uniref:Uncharacterized protein n=1 Tax=Aeromonas veronii TaxID=654 RepID=A0A2T4MWM0_AERVE|nr:hypothetical protein [Aeromonas veronii]PTH78983.1 hypothetical protein DAA48_21325 [Aeromonas veronii]
MYHCIKIDEGMFEGVNAELQFFPLSVLEKEREEQCKRPGYVPVLVKSPHSTQFHYAKVQDYYELFIEPVVRLCFNSELEEDALTKMMDVTKSLLIIGVKKSQGSVAIIAVDEDGKYHITTIFQCFGAIQHSYDAQGISEILAMAMIADM